MTLNEPRVIGAVRGFEIVNFSYLNIDTYIKDVDLCTFIICCSKQNCQYSSKPWNSRAKEQICTCWVVKCSLFSNCAQRNGPGVIFLKLLLVLESLFKALYSSCSSLTVITDKIIAHKLIIFLTVYHTTMYAIHFIPRLGALYWSLPPLKLTADILKHVKLSNRKLTIFYVKSASIG